MLHSLWPSPSIGMSCILVVGVWIQYLSYLHRHVKPCLNTIYSLLSLCGHLTVTLFLVIFALLPFLYKRSYYDTSFLIHLVLFLFLSFHVRLLCWSVSKAQPKQSWSKATWVNTILRDIWVRALIFRRLPHHWCSRGQLRAMWTSAWGTLMVPQLAKRWPCLLMTLICLLSMSGVIRYVHIRDLW